jgi:hypothetical protein
MSGLPKYPSGFETKSTPFCMPCASASCRPLEARLGVRGAGAAAGAGVAAGVVAAGVAAGAAVGAGVVAAGAAAGVLFAGAVVVVVFDVDFVVFAGAFFVVVVFLVCAKAMLVQVSADIATRAIMREYFIVIVKKGKKVAD